MLVTCPLLRPGPNCTAVPVSRELRHLTRTLLALRELYWPGENSASTARTLPTACPDQIRSVTQSCPTLCDPMNSSTPGLPVCPSPTPGVHSDSRPSSRWCHPAISSSVVPFSSLPPNTSQHQSLSNESTLRMSWPKYWSFSFSIIPSKEIPGLISFRMDWLDLLAVQGTLKSPLQHHSSKVSILWCSAFFTVQLSYPYMTTGKTIALTRW